jgi:hypothetical protein
MAKNRGTVGNVDDAIKRDRMRSSLEIGPQRFTYMAHAQGYVMARNGRCRPFLIREKQWLSMPYWPGINQSDPNQSKAAPDPD